MAIKITDKVQHFTVRSQDLTAFLLASDSKGIKLTLHVVKGPSETEHKVSTFAFTAQAGLGIYFTVIKELIFLEDSNKAVFYSSDFVAEISYKDESS